jgi:hypothetical protein
MWQNLSGKPHQLSRLIGTPEADHESLCPGSNERLEPRDAVSDSILLSRQGAKLAKLETQIRSCKNSVLTLAYFAPLRDYILLRNRIYLPQRR